MVNQLVWILFLYQVCTIIASTFQSPPPTINLIDDSLHSSAISCSPIIEQQFIDYDFLCINGCVVLSDQEIISLTSLIFADIPSIITTCITFNNIQKVEIDTLTLSNLVIQIDHLSNSFLQFSNIDSLIISKVTISNITQTNSSNDEPAIFINSTVHQQIFQTVYISSQSDQVNQSPEFPTYPFYSVLSSNANTINVSTIKIKDSYSQILFSSISTVEFDRIIFEQALISQFPLQFSKPTLVLKAKISIKVSSIEIIDKRDPYQQISNDLEIIAMIESKIQTLITIGSISRNAAEISNQLIQSAQNPFKFSFNQENFSNETLMPSVDIQNISASMGITKQESTKKEKAEIIIEIQNYNLVKIGSIVLIDYTKQFMILYSVQDITIGYLSVNGSRTSNSQQNSFITNGCLIYAENSNRIQFNEIILQNVVISQISYLAMRLVEELEIKQISILNSIFLNSQFLYVIKSKSIMISNTFIMDSVVRMPASIERSSQIFIIFDSQSVEYHTFIMKSLNLNLNWIESVDSNQLTSSQSVILSNNCSSHTFTEIHIDFLGLQLGFFSSVNFTDKLVLRNSTFHNCYASLGGGCFSFNINGNNMFMKEPRLLLSNVTFVRASSGYFGGAIFGSEIESVVDVRFESCSSLIGGGLFLKGNSNQDALKNITFYNNTADIVNPNVCKGIDIIKKGQVLEYNPNLQGTPLYLNGLGQYSDTIQFYTGILKRAVQNELNQELFNNGNLFPFVTKNNLLYNQIITSENNLFILYDPTNNFDNDLSNTYIGFTITRNDLYYFKLDSTSSNKCKEGMEKIMFSNGNNHICQYCGLSKAIYPSSSVCQTCDISYFKTCYSNQTELNIGYWRSNYTINTTLIETCSISMSSCNGGFGIGDSLCYEGHIGPQCLNCDIRGEYWGQSYSMSSVFTCNKCSDIQSNEIKIILGFVLISLSLLVIIKGNFKATKNQIFADYLAKLKLIYIGSSLSRLQQMSTYLKVLLFNLYFSNLTNSFTKLRLWKSLSETSVILNQPLVTQFFSFDCFLVKSFSDDLNFGFANLMISIATPGIVFTVYLLLGVLLIIVSNSKKRLMEMRTIVSSLILSFTYLFLIVFYPFIFQLCLKSYFCIRLEGTKTFSQIDLSLECGNPSDNRLQDIHALATPVLCLIIIFMPLATLLFLYSQKAKLRTVSMMLTLGFLYREYKNQFFLWEFARIFLKSVSVFTQVALIWNPQLYGTIITLLLTLYLVLLIFQQPFSGKLFNQLEQISVSIQIISILSAILYSQYELDLIQDGTIIEILFIGSQILNIIFIVSLTTLIIFSFSQKQLIKLHRKWRIPFAEKFLPLYSNQLRNNFKKVRNLVKKFKGRVHSIKVDELQSLLFPENDNQNFLYEEVEEKNEKKDFDLKQQVNNSEFNIEYIDPQTLLKNN